MTESELLESINQLSLLLTSTHTRLATAESCTGGWIAKVATDIEGSSAWFDRGLVTYSNQSKQDQLGVKEATLEQYGAVSHQTVEEMVNGLTRYSGVTIGVAVSGIAGPGGGTDEKPVGTVWISWKIKGNPSLSQHYLFSGNREQIRLQAAIMAVNGLISLLEADQ